MSFFTRVPQDPTSVLFQWSQSLFHTSYASWSEATGWDCLSAFPKATAIAVGAYVLSVLAIVETAGRTASELAQRVIFCDPQGEHSLVSYAYEFLTQIKLAIVLPFYLLGCLFSFSTCFPFPPAIKLPTLVQPQLQQGEGLDQVKPRDPEENVFVPPPSQLSDDEEEDLPVPPEIEIEIPVTLRPPSPIKAADVVKDFEPEVVVRLPSPAKLASPVEDGGPPKQIEEPKPPSPRSIAAEDEKGDSPRSNGMEMVVVDDYFSPPPSSPDSHGMEVVGEDEDDDDDDFADFAPRPRSASPAGMQEAPLDGGEIEEGLPVLEYVDAGGKGYLKEAKHAAQVLLNLWGNYSEKPIVLDPYLARLGNKREAIEREYFNLRPALSDIAENRLLSNAVGDVYDILGRKGAFRACTQFLTPQPITAQAIEAALPALPKSDGSNFIAIPIILSGVRNHNVMILVDLQKKTLEYFNPAFEYFSKDKDRATTLRVDQKVSYTLETVTQIIAKKYKINRVVSNERTYQDKDMHNCGVYCLMYTIWRCIQGKTWDDIQNKPQKIAKNIGPMQYREEILDLVVTELNSSF